MCVSMPMLSEFSFIEKYESLQNTTNSLNLINSACYMIDWTGSLAVRIIGMFYEYKLLISIIIYQAKYRQSELYRSQTKQKK